METLEKRTVPTTDLGGGIYELTAHQETFYFSPTKALVSDQLSEIEAASHNLVKPVTSSKPKVAGLQLEMVHGCNLACSYCAVGQGNFNSSKSIPIKNKVISMETIKESVDWIFDNFEEFKVFEVLYYGGEPLLFPAIVEESAQYISTYCTDRGIETSFKIVTNGTILNATVLDTLERYNMSVQLSVDGPPEIHDAVRIYPSGKGSFLKIKKGFDEMVKRKNIKVHVLAVFKPDNMRLVDLINEMEHWFPNVPVVVRMETPQCSTAVNEETEQYEIDLANKMIEEYDAVSQEIIRRLEQGEFLKSIRNLLTVFHASIESTRQHTFSSHSCSVGHNLISVGPYGQVNPCHGYPMTGTRKMGRFNGSLSTVDSAHLKDINAQTDVDSREPCSSCFARYHCGGYCSVVSESKTGSISEAWTGHCHAIRARSVYGLWLYQTIKNRFPEIFEAIEMQQKLERLNLQLSN